MRPPVSAITRRAISTAASRATVTARDALQMSLNIPAVMVLERVGPLAFTLSLQNAGAKLDLPARDMPTLPVALGGLGISLSDIAMLYAGIAEGGVARGTARHRRHAGRAAPSPVRARWPPVICAAFWMACRCPMAGRWGRG